MSQVFDRDGRPMSRYGGFSVPVADVLEMAAHYAETGSKSTILAAQIRRIAAALSTPPAVPSNFVLMPKELTAENGAKAALIGEFAEVTAALCPDCQGNYDDCFTCNGDGTVSQHVPIKWDTIKRIYRKAVEVCALSAAPAAPDAKNG